MSKYPEHQKLKAIQGKSQSICEFVEWLSEKNIQLAVLEESGDYSPPVRNLTSLVAEFFDIDMKKIDAEKDAMIEEIRRANG